MRKPRRARNIANRINTRFISAHIAIRHNMPTIQFDFSFLQTQIFRIRHNTNRTNHAIKIMLLDFTFNIYMRRNILFILINLAHLRILDNAHTLFC